MSIPSRQQVAAELNKLAAAGATEKQLADAVARAGYTTTDFNIDLNGTFRPMVAGTGTVTQSYTTSGPAQSNQYYENLAASSSVTSKTATNTTTTTQTTNFQQTTGGGSTTVYSTPSTPTSASLAYQAQADQAYNLAESYRLNPDTRFGKSALDRRLADGRLTQEQYNQIVSSTPEQRAAQSSQYSQQYETARSNEINSQTSGQPVVVTQPQQNTSTVNVNYQTTTTNTSTVLTGAVPGSNVTTATIDGNQYQVVPNADGTVSYSLSDDFGNDLSFTLEDPLDSRYASAPLINPEEEELEEIYDDLDDEYYDILSEPPEIDEDEEDEEGYDILREPPDTEEYDEDDEEFDGDFLREPPDIDEEEEPGYDYDSEGSEEEINSYFGAKGTTASLYNTRSQATQQDSTNAYAQGDWRVRLSLAPGANYLYKSDTPGILKPLQETSGVLFPYTPSISVSYAANYDPTDVTHSNYKIYQYRSSSVDQITIGCEFTAQDTKEATYVLAVIHFFRSITKMFYGRDQNPKNGTPPPLCYLTGMGSFQFDRHPIAVTNFSLSLPTDVDYIRAGSTTAIPGTNAGAQVPRDNVSNQSLDRLTTSATKIGFGGVSAPPNFNRTPSGSVEATYVPTKLQIQISAIPIVSRNDISNNFSLRDYASGKLLRGSKNSNGTGIW